MNIIAYILFILQAVSLFLCFRAGLITQIIADLVLANGISGLIAGILKIVFLFLPAILGSKFMKWHKRNKLTVTKKMLKADPGLEYWVCSKCKARNYMDKSTCPVCGITKQFSDHQKK